ncbi:MAG: Lipid biosynthesis lauroyl acyltransferase [Micavibrio sp.]|nr:Lipid biosynthesis lauroyl acyltransferase [Micavibrio sp.]
MKNSEPKINILKKVLYALEFIPLGLMIGFFALLPPVFASRIAGSLGRNYGPKFGKSRKAIAHLKMALPGKTDDEYKAIVAGMWDNLARIFAEYPSLNYYGPRVEMVGIEHLKGAFDDYGQVILFSGHIGNWEVMAPALLEYGIELDLVYRAPNNPWADKVLDYFRSMNGKLVTIPKSKAGTRLLVERMRDNKSIGILIDQKYNEGIAAPFFGHPAMTSPAFVQLGQKFDCPVIPFRVERVDGANFRLNFFEPLALFDEQGVARPADVLITEAHALLEGWIRERPEQWLWLHRRWIDVKNPGKKAAAKMAGQGAKKPAPKTSPPRRPDPQKPAA